jgi:hypothetical protein
VGSLFIVTGDIYDIGLRRYIYYDDWSSSHHEVNEFLFGVVLAMAAAQALFIFNLVYSAVWGKKSRNWRKFSP